MIFLCGKEDIEESGYVRDDVLGKIGVCLGCEVILTVTFYSMTGGNVRELTFSYFREVLKNLCIRGGKSIGKLENSI